MTPRLSLLIVLGLAVLALASAQAQQPSVRAESGGVAIGGSVSGSTINIGIPPEQLEALIRQSAEHSETQKKLISDLESKLDLNQRQVRAALDILGEKDIPSERLAAKLVEIAERFKALQATALAQPGDDAKVTALKAEAQKAIDEGDLAKADALLAEVETEQRGMLDRLAVNAADTSARRGDIALTRLRYGEAAQHFANAAAVLPVQTRGAFGGLGIEVTMEDGLVKVVAPIDDRPAAKAGIRANDVITHFDDEAVQGMTLNQAVEKMRGPVNTKIRLRIMRKGTDKPIEVAITRDIIRECAEGPHQNQRIDYLRKEAIALYLQRYEFGDNGALLLAIERRRALLYLVPRERVPLDWAETQNSLGTALARLGERESGTARLNEAIVAFRDALTERTRERVPAEWAATQNDLGIALRMIGERESDAARLNDAVAALRDALAERTRERVPLDWAMTQMNLGNALEELGERESGTARLNEAIAAFRDALKEYTRERVPFGWAATQTSLGIALTRLGEREGGTARLEEPVAAYREALKEYTREQVPLQWAATQNNLGNALTRLGEREGGTARLEEAIAAFREALKGFTTERAQYYRDVAQKSLDAALKLLDEHKRQTQTEPRDGR